MDALLFLGERGELHHLHNAARAMWWQLKHAASQLSVTDLLGAEGLLPGPSNVKEVSQETLLEGQNPHREDHRGLEVTENLPGCISEGEEDRCQRAEGLIVNRRV